MTLRRSQHDSSKLGTYIDDRCLGVHLGQVRRLRSVERMGVACANPSPNDLLPSVDDPEAVREGSLIRAFARRCYCVCMRIESLFPAAIEAICDLPVQLRAEGRERGLSELECDGLVALLPFPLSRAGCFLDRFTGLWKYEFGEPARIGNELIWGHLWTPVSTLFEVLARASRRLPPEKMSAFMARLSSNPDRHLETLAEMLPMLRVDLDIPADHEVSGRGIGNKTIDWEIGPYERRRVLLDVKRRFLDFLGQMGDASPSGIYAEPGHDHALMFRSVEEKFCEANPDDVLQGVWIWTDIKQEKSEFADAFERLAPQKVHFAIIGDARPDIHLVTRRDVDRAFLLNLFKTSESPRFTFTRGAKPSQAG